MWTWASLSLTIMPAFSPPQVPAGSVSPAGPPSTKPSQAAARRSGARAEWVRGIGDSGQAEARGGGRGGRWRRGIGDWGQRAEEQERGRGARAGLGTKLTQARDRVARGQLSSLGRPSSWPRLTAGSWWSASAGLAAGSGWSSLRAPEVRGHAGAW